MQVIEADGIVMSRVAGPLDSNRQQTRTGSSDMYLSQVKAFRTIRDALANNDCGFAKDEQRQTASQAARLIAKAVGDAPLRITIFGDSEDQLLEVTADSAITKKRLVIEIHADLKYRVRLVHNSHVITSGLWTKLYDAPNLVRWLING